MSNGRWLFLVIALAFAFVGFACAATYHQLSLAAGTRLRSPVELDPLMVEAMLRNQVLALIVCVLSFVAVFEAWRRTA